MVRTDSVSRAVAVFVFSHKNKLFSETCKKSACFVGYLSERDLCKLYEIEKVLENTQKLACFDAYQVRGILGSFHEKEIFFKISYIFAFLDAYQVRGDLSSLQEKYLKVCKLLAYFNAYHMRGISSPKIFFAKHPHKTPFSPR